MANYDFHGWATKANLRCSDGRTIMPDAFKHNDGKTVPLVWNHQYNDPSNVLGHALLENRNEGVYAYCTFNDSENGQLGKILVQHGDIKHLSIAANRLKQNGGNVLHGEIREVSLVHAGANPGATITSVIAHSDTGEPIVSDDECIIHTGLDFELYHADDEQKGDSKVSEDVKKPESEKTIADVINSMNEEQQNVFYAMVGEAMANSAVEEDEEEDEEAEHSEGGENYMKHNVFDAKGTTQEIGLSHADQQEILAMAKSSGVGSLKHALEIYAAENEDSLQHGVFEKFEDLFPEYELMKKGAPELLERDQSWIGYVMGKIHKAPFSRIRTRQADARIAELRAKGYQKKGDEKKIGAKIKLLGRTTDPQTVYIKEDMHRDDIIDITEFDAVAYQWNVMRHVLNEELALAALIGDGRDDGDPDKIHPEHIRPIWGDDELYTIHAEVDIAAAKTELQGSNTGANFGDNYVYAEAIIRSALYAKEQYKGSGSLDLFCTPHLLNVMLLARDLNGRRIYDSKADLAAALNVNAIHTVEQFEGKTRTTEGGAQKKLLGLFVNLNDYTFGSTKGGEVTKFEDFDMDFNKYKYLLETRLSGALTKPYSAIALEEPAEDIAG